jgi:hypothetical protein
VPRDLGFIKTSCSTLRHNRDPPVQGVHVRFPIEIITSIQHINIPAEVVWAYLFSMWIQAGGGWPGLKHFTIEQGFCFLRLHRRRVPLAGSAGLPPEGVHTVTDTDCHPGTAIR